MLRFVDHDFRFIIKSSSMVFQPSSFIDGLLGASMLLLVTSYARYKFHLEAKGSPSTNIFTWGVFWALQLGVIASI